MVVGAGPGGLYAGHLLQRAGVSYEILEASDRVGGRVVSRVHGQDVIDVGAQVFHSSYAHVEGLIRRLRLRADCVEVNGATRYQRADGQAWVQGRVPYMPGLGLRGNLALWRYALGRLLVDRRQRLHRIEWAGPEDALSVAEYIDRHGADAFHRFLLPLLCAAMNVASPEHTSVQHLHHVFRIAALTRMYTFRRGNEQLWQAVAAGQPVQLGRKVAEVVCEQGRVRGVRLAGNGETLAADHVILATSPHTTEDLLPATMAGRRAFFRDIPKIAQCIPVVHLDRRLDAKLVNYMAEPRAGRHFVMAIDAANKAPTLVPSGRSVLTLWDAHPASARLAGMPDAEVTALAMSDLQQLVPGFSPQWVRDVEIVRHAYSHTPYGPGSYRRIVDFLAQEQGQDGLHFTSDLFGGSYMECALIMAHRVVSRIVPGADLDPLTTGVAA
ncbi:MAG: NAD(P)/FAD-dependent oxidoreductase [Dehalococcoidia bacterium]